MRTNFMFRLLKTWRDEFPEKKKYKTFFYIFDSWYTEYTYFVIQMSYSPDCFEYVLILVIFCTRKKMIHEIIEINLIRKKLINDKFEGQTLRLTLLYPKNKLNSRDSLF